MGGSENCTRKVRLLDVVYNASSNELVRTKTLVKNAIVQIDGAPFKQWYVKHYGVELGKKQKRKSVDEDATDKKSAHVQAKLKHRVARQKLNPLIEDQFNSG